MFCSPPAFSAPFRLPDECSSGSSRVPDLIRGPPPTIPVVATCFASRFQLTPVGEQLGLETQEEGVVRDECKPCRDRVPGCGDLTEFVEQTSPVDVGVPAPGIKLDRVLEVCQSPLHVTQLQPGIR